MSCPTAKSWFVPDEVYDLTQEDYVFCNQDARVTGRAITDMMEHVNCEECKECLGKEIKTYFDYLQHGPRWLFDKDRGGKIIYMDSNEKDKTHRQHLFEMRAKEKRLEAGDILRTAHGTLSKYLGNIKLSKDEMAAGSVRSGEMADLSEYMYLGPHTIDCVITQKTPEEKKIILTYMSGQAGLNYIRPTILFIGAIWNVLLTPGQPTPGLAFAYDFLKDVIIVKTITYESGKHPLATPWPTKKNEDGFYLCTRPKDILQVMKSAEARKGLQDTAFWFHVILLGLVGKWVLRHGKALGMSTQGREDLTKHLDIIKADLEKAPLPSFEKRIPVEKNEVIEALEGLLFDLQCGEGRVREVAVMAKEAGMAATAESLAKDFEKSVADMKRLIEHPEKPSVN
ncbi:hypothetical protein MMC30_000854 [Trapelia coarctata]|nr:hypothetical protein [Trapelia coarctata]